MNPLFETLEIPSVYPILDFRFTHRYPLQKDSFSPFLIHTFINSFIHSFIHQHFAIPLICGHFLFWHSFLQNLISAVRDFWRYSIFKRFCWSSSMIDEMKECLRTLNWPRMPSVQYYYFEKFQALMPFIYIIQSNPHSLTHVISVPNAFSINHWFTIWSLCMICFYCWLCPETKNANCEFLLFSVTFYRLKSW